MPFHSIEHLKTTFLRICMGQYLTHKFSSFRRLESNDTLDMLWDLERQLEKHLIVFTNKRDTLNDQNLTVAWQQLKIDLESSFDYSKYSSLNEKAIQFIKTIQSELINLFSINDDLLLIKLKNTFTEWFITTLIQDLGYAIYVNKYPQPKCCICYSPTYAEQAYTLQNYLRLAGVEIVLNVSKQIGETFPSEHITKHQWDHIVLIPGDEPVDLLREEFNIIPKKSDSKISVLYFQNADNQPFIEWLKDPAYYSIKNLQEFFFTFIKLLHNNNRFIIPAIEHTQNHFETEIIKYSTASLEQLLNKLKPQPQPQPEAESQAPVTPRKKVKNLLLRFFNVPRDSFYGEHFTVRLDVLKTINSQLNDAELPNILACSGLSGVGKTQLVLQYINQHHNEYQHVLWFTAQSRESLHQQFYELIRQLRLTFNAEETHQTCINLINDWLKLSPSVLIIYDDILDFSLINELSPPAHAHIVLTTPRNDFSNTLIVKSFTLEESVQCIEQIINGGECSGSDKANIEKIGQQFSCLPLALVQVSSWISMNYLNADQYLDICDRAIPQEIFMYKGMENLTIQNAFEKTFAMISQESPSALLLLNVIAFWSADEFEESILKKLLSVLRLNGGGSLAGHSEGDMSEINVLVNFNVLERSYQDGQARYSILKLLKTVIHNKYKDDIKSIQSKSKELEEAISHEILIERGQTTAQRALWSSSQDTLFQLPPQTPQSDSEELTFHMQH
jgi:hypothetical protein